MMNARKSGLFASILIILSVIIGASHADLTPTGSVIRTVFDYASGRSGKYRLDAVNNYFVFGSSKQAPGAVVTSSGTLVVQSTSSTTGYKFFKLLNYAGTELLSMAQNGAMVLPASSIIGPSIAQSTIPLSALNQSGANTNNVIAWNGTKWAPAAAAVGDMITTTNNQMASGGGITFLSGSNLTLNKGSTADGICYRVDFASFSAVSSVTPFSALSSSTNYKMTGNVLQNSSNGVISLVFNGDTGSNYVYTVFESNITDSANSESTTGSSCWIGGGVQNVLATGHLDFNASFRTTWTNSKKVMVNFESNFDAATVTYEQTHGGCKYTGAANLSSISLTTSAGTITGYAELWNCGSWKLQN